MNEHPPSLEDFQRAAELRASIRTFLRRSEQLARANGLTPQRHLLLLMIKGAADGSQRSTVTMLSERLQLAQSTVTELVSRAESAGLLVREPAPEDGRVTHLRLTAEGEGRLEATVTALGRESDRLAELLDDVREPAAEEDPPA